MTHSFPFKQNQLILYFGFVLIVFYIIEYFIYGHGPYRMAINLSIGLLAIISSNILKLSRIEASVDQLKFFNPLGIKYKTLLYSDILFSRLHSDRIYILKKDKRNIQVNIKQMTSEELNKFHLLLQKKLEQIKT